VMIAVCLKSWSWTLMWLEACFNRTFFQSFLSWCSWFFVDIERKDVMCPLLELLIFLCVA